MTDIAVRELPEVRKAPVSSASDERAVDAYARQAKDGQMEIDAAEIRIRAERRLGELMALHAGTVLAGCQQTRQKPQAPTLAEN